MDIKSLVSRSVQQLRSEGLTHLLMMSWQYINNYYGQSAFCYYRSRRQLRKAMKNESDSLERILDTVFDVEPGVGYYEVSTLQLREELRGLAEIVADNEPEVVMEIGTAQGGTLYTWSRYLDSPELYISIDIPGRSFHKNFYPYRQKYFDSFDLNTETAFVWQNSHLDETFNSVSEEIIERNMDVDFLFIDGDHSYEGVKQDFEKYKELVSDNGIIALHDIVYHPDDPEVVEQRREDSDAKEQHLRWNKGHQDCEVHEYWKEIRDNFETEELISHPDQSWGGIGVVYL